MHKAVEGNQLGRENRMEKDSSDSSSLRNPFLKLSKILLKFAKHVAQAIMQMVKGMAVMLNSLYKKLLSAILRSAFAVMLVMDFFADDLTLYLVFFFFFLFNFFFMSAKPKYQTTFSLKCSKFWLDIFRHHKSPCLIFKYCMIK